MTDLNIDEGFVVLKVIVAINLPPGSVPVLKLVSAALDAAPNLIPAGLLAMQGRYLGMPR